MLTLRVNATDVISTLDNIAVRQLPFATSKALMATALDFQARERLRMAQVFTVRRKKFIFEQGVKILSFPSKDRLSVTIGQDPKADFLAKFELGGIKESIVGGSLAIPVDVPRSSTGTIPPSMRPRALLDVATSRLAQAGRVFIVQPGAVDILPPGIYQIMSRGRGGLRLLYDLIPKARIDARLGFETTARRTVEDRWAVNFSEAFQRALETARP